MRRRSPTSPWTRDDDPLAVFVRGATVGAFVGAMIAGSTIWRRVRRHAAPAADASTPDTSAPASALLSTSCAPAPRRAAASPSSGCATGTMVADSNQSSGESEERRSGGSRMAKARNWP